MIPASGRTMDFVVTFVLFLELGIGYLAGYVKGKGK